MSTAWIRPGDTVRINDAVRFEELSDCYMLFGKIQPGGFSEVGKMFLKSHWKFIKQDEQGHHFLSYTPIAEVDSKITMQDVVCVCFLNNQFSYAEHEDGWRVVMLDVPRQDHWFPKDTWKLDPCQTDCFVFIRKIEDRSEYTFTESAK